MFDENAHVAWNAAYWLLRSESRRQLRSRFPDCDWNQVEEHEDCVAAVIEAQTRICVKAMQGPNSALRQYT